MQGKMINEEEKKHTAAGQKMKNRTMVIFRDMRRPNRNQSLESATAVSG